MAEVTEDRLKDLVSELRKSVPEVEAHDADAAGTMADGARDIEYHLEGGHLDMARRSAKDLWGHLLEFPVFRSFVGSRAPGQNAPAKARGLEQTADAIETFNEIVVEIGTLPR